ncbi:hypothetical protein CDO52_23690 [Nocardiopsis gilva YIM 90087]|uniref:Hint domain-containing protein n=1 Tax=Nocardiopsis gilva YIM 90087 TaxID=1235441 RepID=A0A223SBK4_9ACTN|nr:hypothetical protein CDO52_23690 [Nocardiopsis gilva YIM 90087]
MALVMAIGLLSVMPASAIAYNHRPDAPDEASIAGSDASVNVAPADDETEKAALTELPDAEWPEPETIEIPAGGSEASSGGAEPVVSAKALPEKEAEEWESPLPEADDQPQEKRGAEETDEAPSERRDAVRSPGPDSAAVQSSPTPEPSPEADSPSEQESGQEPDTPSEQPRQPEPAPEREPAADGDPEPSQEDATEDEPSAEPSALTAVEGADLEILDREAAEKAGVSGLLLRLKRTDGSDSDGPVEVSVDYSDFATAFGADYGSRLRLVAVDECVLEQGGCPGDAPDVVELDSENNADAQTVTAVAPASAGTDVPEPGAYRSALAPTAPSGGGSGTLLALAAAPTGGTGDYSATPLQASSTWSVGEQTGDFTWSYPMETPGVAAGESPEIGLSYSSQSVDGRTASSNNQTSWVGEGFSYDAGYIERRYKACMQDGQAEGSKTGDQCWGRHNATMSLNGTSTELIIDKDGDWHPRNDDGSRIERLTGAKNGDNDGEYWRVTTTDGTQYYFGRNRLPGWSKGKPETKSTWTVPVYGNDSGEPCHASSFADSWCQQAYRWNLDYEVDVHGNVTTYYYDKYTDYYGRNVKTEATPYTRAGNLNRIEYGLRSDDVFAKAPARVKFTVGERCIPSKDFDCAPKKRTEANAKHWPDVPTDQECKKDEKCVGKHSPSFWSTKKLDKVTTEVYDGSGYKPVDSWKLEHSYPKPGDGTDPALWLKSVTHTGHVGGTETMPKVVFHGQAMENRVDSTRDGPAPMLKYRITSVSNETGGRVHVEYSAPECTAGSTPKPDKNTKRCYPVIWTPEGEEELTDWFHKYVVTRVTEEDLVGGQPDVVTSYEYLGGGAWHFDDADGLVPEKQKTWSQWRGYERVKVREGHPDDTRSETEYLFYRGMDGDKLSSGKRSVKITDSEGGTDTDHDAFNGQTREVIERNGPGGEVISKEISIPWKKQTAERKYKWGTLRSYHTDTQSERTYTPLEGGKQRVTLTDSTFDEYGFLSRIDDHGDVSDPDDDQCVRVSYARNTDKWLIALQSREEVLSVKCGEKPTYPDDVISDERILYDGKGFGEKPTRGLVTKAQELEDYDGDTPKYLTISQGTYDKYGRQVTDTDAAGNVSKTSYSSDVPGGPETEIANTNVLGHTTTVRMDPLRSSLVSETDANGNRTDLAYDPLGRMTSVWLADRDKEKNKERPSAKFEYNIRADAPSSVVTYELNNRGDYVASYEIYDGMLRPRQQQSPGIDGRLISEVFYDSRGNVVLEREAYPNGEEPSDKLFVVNNEDEIPRQTESVYDGAGRQTATVQRSRGKEVLRTSVQELGDRTLVTVPAGDTATTTLYDARGRMTEMRQHHGNKPEGKYDATKYTYTKADELATVTDPAGNVWKYRYDLRGRQIKTVDPDAGTTTFKYDELDQLVSQTDGRGRTLAYTYDELGRQTGVFEDSPKGTQRVGMVYDTVQKGQLSSATRYSGNSAYTQRVLKYNKLYQPLMTEISIPESEGVLSGKYRFATDYNPDGSTQSVVLPKAGKLPRELVQYHYNELGMPTMVQAGRDKVVSEAKFSKIGELVQREFHKGNSGAKKTWATYDYDRRTGRLSSISTVPEIGSGSLSHQSYTYDDAGNVLSISDKPTAEGLASDTQCFAYDGLRRLTEAWTSKPGEDDDKKSCAEKPSADALGGAAPYWHSYAYDKVGNRLTETKHSASSSGDTVRTYTHPDPGKLQPHALTKVEETGPEGDRLEKYGYDESGNMTSRLTAEHDQNLEWDAEGNLVKVTEGDQATSYTYDANGQRLLRRDAQSSTLYLPGMELRFDAAEQKTEATRYYEHAGETVAMRENDGSLHWLISDHHGSGQLAIDASTGEAVQRRFTPFGEERSSTGEWPGEKGFVGGTIDASTGLTQLGARAYDAAIGRFISVDPVMDPTDAQQMHGYVYSNNNPVTWSDPSGMFLDKAWNWTKSKVKKGVKKAKKVYNKGKKYVKRQYKKVKKYVKKKYHQAKRYVRKKYHQARRYVRRAYHKTKSYVKRAYRATSSFVRRHKNTIIATGAGIAVGAACSVATAGAGTIGCAALGGAVSGLVQYQLDTPKEQWSVTDALTSTALGGAFGAAGGALGGKVASAASSKIGSMFSSGASRAGAGGGRSGLSSKLSGFFSRSKGGGAARNGPTGCNSFVPGTGVLMADGSKKPIEDVDVGEKVIATDPETGEQSEKTVLATIIGQGSKDLVEITVDTSTEKPAEAELGPDAGGLNGNGGMPGPLAGGDIIIATEAHPFWVPELGEWLDAGDLRPGMWLETSSGTWVQVTATRAWTQSAKVHNLTVEGIHTYNVAVGASSDVLTHNCGGLDALSRSGMRPDKNNLTRAGREYQKHMGRGDLPKVSGKEFDSAGQSLLDDILTHPSSAVSPVTSGGFRGGTRHIMPDSAGGRGFGATFDSSGLFQYFGRY